MGLNADQRMKDILRPVGGVKGLRLKLMEHGYSDWRDAKFYPVVAYFPKYMDSSDVVGVAVRRGYSFKIVYGCVMTDFEGVNDWFKYVSLHDDYNSLTEALLDHNKALIATEVDYKDSLTMSWEEILEEVHDGVRRTKYDVDDDDFLHSETMNITFGVSPDFSDSSDIVSFLDALKDFTTMNPNRFVKFIEQQEVEKVAEIKFVEDLDWSDEFLSEWA
jgi:hypothetical protein